MLWNITGTFDEAFFEPIDAKLSVKLSLGCDCFGRDYGDSDTTSFLFSASLSLLSNSAILVTRSSYVFSYKFLIPHLTGVFALYYYYLVTHSPVKSFDY